MAGLRVSNSRIFCPQFDVIYAPTMAGLSIGYTDISVQIDRGFDLAQFDVIFAPTMAGLSLGYTDISVQIDIDLDLGHCPFLIVVVTPNRIDILSQKVKFSNF